MGQVKGCHDDGFPADENEEKMQLDVGVSPPVNIMTVRPGLTYLTFDLDPSDL